jgi:hypothetical protein
VTVGAEQIGGTMIYYGNLEGKTSLSNGTMKVRNENGSTVIRASGAVIVKNHNQSTVVNSNGAK